MTFRSWMAESIGSIPTKTIECVCVSPASKEQIKFVYSVLKWLRTKTLNKNWQYWVAKKKTKACLNLELITGKEIYIQWWRFTFDKHFVPKLCRQKRNRSLEDFWSKEKLRIIKGPLKPRKAGEGPLKVHVANAADVATCTGKNSQQQTSAVRSVWWSTSTASAIQWLSSMKKHFKLLFSRRKMWR